MASRKRTRHIPSRNVVPKIVMVDMGFTVLVLKAGSVARHTVQVYREFGKIRQEVSDELLVREIHEARRLFDGTPETAKEREAYWLAINVRILDRLSVDPDRASRLAKDIRREFLNINHLTVSRLVLHMVRKIRHRGIPVVIASNATEAEAVEKLGHFKLLNEFDGIVTSAEAGFRKPNPDFFRFVLSLNGLPESSSFLHIGNSLFSDAGASILPGGEVWIIDRDGRYSPHSSEVKLDEQFSVEYATKVRANIANGRLRFAKQRTQLVEGIMARIS
jgi:FMN phosphatase YigB (HAD superfamily)